MPAAHCFAQVPPQGWHCTGGTRRCLGDGTSDHHTAKGGAGADAAVEECPVHAQPGRNQLQDQEDCSAIQRDVFTP